jgi:hypothetical protein
VKFIEDEFGLLPPLNIARQVRELLLTIAEDDRP